MLKETDAALQLGAAAWNAWRRSQQPDSYEAPVVRRVTSLAPGRDLQGIDFSNVVIHEGNFSGADLAGARFDNSTIEYADLSGANLSGASFYRTRIRWADLRNADLRESKLRECCFENTTLAGANFADSSMFHTQLSNIDLSDVCGLEGVVHQGPSTVGIDTIYASKGKISDNFLRGTGVPESLISYQQSLVQAVAPIQFYSCFLSYSHQDEEFAKRLHSRLRQEGMRVWFAPEEMKGGRKLIDQVDEAIRVHDKLLLVVSPASMASEWVATEISKARRREKLEATRVLFPIRLVDLETIKAWELFDADVGKDSAREVREIFIPDFSHWKHQDHFEAALAGLLDALRSGNDELK